MKISKIRDLLITEYGTCFLGGNISRKNPYTGHHIKPVRDGGETTIRNIALLGRLQHDMHNVIEKDNYIEGKMLNEYYTYYKQTKDGLALMQMKRYIENEIRKRGYTVEDRGKILTLKRR